MRIVSLNLCADELVLRLADRENVASVTFLVRDPLTSNVADVAAGVPVNHGMAEEIVALRPDLVLASAVAARPAVALLRRAGVPVRDVALASNLPEVRQQIRDVARIIGEPARGEEMIVRMDARLAAVRPPRDGARLRALVLNPSGFASGSGTLVDAIISAAGLVNVAPELGIGAGSDVPLEAVALSQVDILVLNAERDAAPSLATEMLRHPVFAELAKRTRIVVLPARLWTCGGPAVVEAIERLSEVAARPRPTGALP